MSARRLPPSGSSPFNNDRVQYYMSLVDGPGFAEIDAADAELDVHHDALADNINTMVGLSRPQPMTVEDHAFGGGPESGFAFLNYHNPGQPVGANTIRKDTASSMMHNPRLLVPSHTETFDHLIARLASCSGEFQIAEDSCLRFFGATSHLQLRQNGPLSFHQPNIKSLRSFGEDSLRRAGLQWEMDPEYEEALMREFFQWDNPFLRAVDQEVFLRQRTLFRAGQDSIFYSATLENALLAVGAMYSKQPHIAINGDAAEFFAARVQVLLEIELDSPTYGTLQALVVMCTYYAAQGHESRGWLYSGMAARLLTDLGLHLDQDLSGRIECHENVTALRRSLLWAVYSLDTLWSSWCGRPSSMVNFDIALYGDPNAMGATQIQIALLMGHLRQVLENVYSSPHHLFPSETELWLQQWSAGLPPSLQLINMKEPNHRFPPELLELHMQYHEVIILLNRPFLLPPSAISTMSPNLDQAAVALNACTSSATEICRLLRIFRQKHGLRHIQVYSVHVLMTASLVHVYNNCCSPGIEGGNAREMVLECISAFVEIGETLKCGKRALEIVTSIRLDLQNEARRS